MKNKVTHTGSTLLTAGADVADNSTYSYVLSVDFGFSSVDLSTMTTNLQLYSCAVLGGAFVLALLISRHTDNGRAVSPAVRTLPISPARSDTLESRRNEAVKVPKVRLEAIVLRQAGEASALLSIDGETATWYHRGEVISPGFVITSIIRNQITVRQGDAYYEYLLHKSNS